MKRKITQILTALICFLCFNDAHSQIIKGKVYIDYNSNGQLDTSDYTFSGAYVKLYIGCDLNSILLDSVRTDSLGNYDFTGLDIGQISVRFGYGTNVGITLYRKVCK